MCSSGSYTELQHFLNFSFLFTFGIKKKFSSTIEFFCNFFGFDRIRILFFKWKLCFFLQLSSSLSNDAAIKGQLPSKIELSKCCSFGSKKLFSNCARCFTTLKTRASNRLKYCSGLGSGSAKFIFTIYLRFKFSSFDFAGLVSFKRKKL